MYPTVVSIDYSVLQNNFRAYRNRFPRKTLVPVIKGDGYGHGMVETARAFRAGGATHFAVFRLEEAEILRANGIAERIWVLLGALPVEVQRAVLLENVTLVVFNLEQAHILSDAALAAGKRIDVHLAVDTGMGRLGFLPDEAIAGALQIQKMAGLHLCGICSHVARAAEPEYPVTVRQVSEFRRVVEALKPVGCVQNHLCASVALMNQLAPELEYARPGICLYMKNTLPGESIPITEDAMTLKTQLVSLKTMPAGSTISYYCLRTLTRESRIAVALVGYEDGLIRSLSNKAFALVHGKRVPLLGRVCMSMVMLDVTDVPDVRIGDEAVFLGKQGCDQITIQEMGVWGDTTEHEFLCNLGRKRIN